MLSELWFTYNIGMEEYDFHAKKEKCILHMDGDAFFVGVEVAKNPKLKGLPVVTGEERGIASALSYEAKALGLTRGYPVYKIKKEFPQVIILPGDYRSYAQYSEMMFDIVRRYTDDIEEYSIDECFADLTGLDKPSYMTYREMAERIKKDIVRELSLSVSVGLGPTKVLAKVGSKWKKPDGLTVIEKETAWKFLQETPIEKIWGIGPRTAHYLKTKKIETALDFSRQNISWIREKLAKPQEIIWHELNGFQVMEIDSAQKTEYSSMQRTRTFHPPTNDVLFLLSQLSKNTEEVCAKARHYGLVPKSISFFIKTQSFRYFSFSVPLDIPTNSPEIIIGLVRKYFKKVYKRNENYRTTGITLHELSPAETTQLDLFGKSSIPKKFEEIHKHLDVLEEKVGKRLVYLGTTDRAKKRKTKGTDSDDLDRSLLFL